MTSEDAKIAKHTISLAEECRWELQHLQELASEFRSSNEASRNFLASANKLDKEICVQLQKNAKELRILAEMASDPFVRGLLLELAEAYEQIAAPPV